MLFWVLVMMIRMRFFFRVMIFAAAAAFLINICGLRVFSEENTGITAADIAGYSAERKLAFPSQMRGFYAVPSVDFLCGKPDGEGYTEEEVYSEINSMLDRAAQLSMNTLILGTSYEGIVFYDTEINNTVTRTAVDYASEIALSRGFYLYLVFDINTALSNMDKAMTMNERIDRLAVIVRNITLRYSADGIIFDGYYGENSSEAFADYMKYGSGIGYEQWIYESNAYIFKTAANAVRRTSNTAAAGIFADGVWANGSEMTGGSDTHAGFQALFDGYADNYSYVKKGWTDFILLRTEEGISSERIPFENITAWWNDAAQEADIRLFVLHENENVCTGEMGWDYPDELVKQVISAEGLSHCRGSVFSSLSALEENREQSTEVLMKHYSHDLDTQGLNIDLEMTLPEQTDFRTDESSVIFAGSFDPNFDVLFQGEPIELNDAGRFYFNMELNVGENEFTFENKGRTVTYHIVRTVRVLKNAQPRGSDIFAEGGTELSVTAEAYRGSSLIAYINDEIVPLHPAEGLSEDIDPNSSYTLFRGSYTLPEGGDSLTDLGDLRVYAAYPIGEEKILECITGSRIYINPRPAVNTGSVVEIPNVPNQPDFGEESVTGGSAEIGQLVKILSDNTMTWSSRNTLTEPVPDCTRLPAGTKERLSKTVTYGSTSYYLTESGRRIRTSEAELVDGDISDNISVSLTGMDISEGNTVLVLDTGDNIPFEIGYGGFSYTNGNNGYYYVENFSADKLYIDFDYASDFAESSVQIPENGVFGGYEWTHAPDGRVRLSLTLTAKGAYDGVKAHYEGNTLMLSFNGIERSLEGMTIVIDPGHGYIGNGKFDPGAVGHIHEQSANLAISVKLEEKLRAAGANVVRLQTESRDYVTPQRADFARRYSPDMYLAVHCNSGSSTATGGEAYYFTPFSQPLAREISAELGKVLSQVHGDGGNYDRGEKYNYFYVTQQQEFPSVLIECGFVSNYTEAMALADEGYRDMFAQAIMNGITSYIQGR